VGTRTEAVLASLIAACRAVVTRVALGCARHRQVCAQHAKAGRVNSLPKRGAQ